jgi:hypothetical protein
MTTTPTDNDLRQRAKALGLYGLLAHWDDVASLHWVPLLLQLEAQERQRRSLERRFRTGRIGRFKPLADFDCPGPKRSTATPSTSSSPCAFSKRGYPLRSTNH